MTAISSGAHSHPHHSSTSSRFDGHQYAPSTHREDRTPTGSARSEEGRGTGLGVVPGIILAMSFDRTPSAA